MCPNFQGERWSTVTASESSTAGSFDLLLKGGHVIDPANGRDGPMDVAIVGDKIARVAPGIGAGAAARLGDDSGLYVTPGLIGIHVHVYPHWGAAGPQWQARVIPDAHSFRA